ncbi:MAG: hypothetical protein HOL48_04735 [Porticoccaceae bacterium]|jgi:hypothetical protein|nr:hypothetical protein [Porticoccaceae bacterium]
MRVLALVFVIGVPLVFAFVWLRKQQQKRQAELEEIQQRIAEKESKDRSDAVESEE